MTNYQIFGGVIVLLQFIAGGFAFYSGEPKTAILSIGYGILNAVLYYVR